MVFTFTETCNLIIMKMLHTVFYFEASPLKIIEGRKERKKRTTTTKKTGRMFNVQYINRL